MRVVLSTEKLSAYGLSPMAIVGHLQAANASVQAGSFAENNQEVRVDAGNLFTNREDFGSRGSGRGSRASGVSARRCEKIVDGAASRRTMWSTEQRTQARRLRANIRL